MMEFTSDQQNLMTDDDSDPWIAHSIFDFHYFCCPECDDKSQNKQDFVNHVSIYHSGVSIYLFSPVFREQ